MNSPGGSNGSSGSSNQGGSSGNQQGGGSNGSSNPTATSADTATYTTAITTANVTPTTTASPTSTPSSNITHNDNRAVIIGGTVGGVAGILFIIFFLIWIFNRRSKAQAKKQQAAADKENGTLPPGTGVPTVYSGLSRSFVGQPEDRLHNPNELSTQPPFGRDASINMGSGRASIASRRSARNQVNGLGNRDRDLEDGVGRSDDHEDLLPPTYEESQSDVLSIRVLTPQHPQPSRFIDQSAARATGFLSPQLSPSPYTSQIYSPDSLQTEFYQHYGTATPYHQDEDGYESGDGSRGLRRNNSMLRDSSTLGYVSPLSPLEMPRFLGTAAMGMGSEQGLRDAADSLESLVRGPGGILKRSTSGRTVSTVSTISTVSAVSDDGDLRGVSEGLGMREEMRGTRNLI